MINITIPETWKVLAVDDNPTRIEWFRKKMPDCTVAMSPAEADSTLNSGIDFDMIFLDHDCDGSLFVDPTDPEFLNKSFWQTAEHLHRTKYEGYVVIHSGNPVGARRMANLLGGPRAYFSTISHNVRVAPFGSFDIHIGKILENIA